MWQNPETVGFPELSGSDNHHKLQLNSFYFSEKIMKSDIHELQLYMIQVQMLVLIWSFKNALQAMSRDSTSYLIKRLQISAYVRQGYKCNKKSNASELFSDCILHAKLDFLNPNLRTVQNTKLKMASSLLMMKHNILTGRRDKKYGKKWLCMTWLETQLNPIDKQMVIAPQSSGILGIQGFLTVIDRPDLICMYKLSQC